MSAMQSLSSRHMTSSLATSSSTSLRTSAPEITCSDGLRDTSWVPRISIGGHLGGLVAGAALAAMYVAAMRRQIDPRASAAAGALFGLVLFAGSLWAAAQWLDPIF